MSTATPQQANSPGRPVGKSLGRASLAMSSGTAVSRILGFMRTAMLAGAIGMSQAGNAFASANKLPTLTFLLIAGGVLNSVLVPQLTKAFRDPEGEDTAHRLLTFSATLLLGLTVVLTIAAPFLMHLFTDFADPAAFDLAVALALWCMPQVLFYGLYSLLGQVLNARGSFGPYMWAPALNNLVSMVGLGVFIAVRGVYRTGAAGVDNAATWSNGDIALLGGTATLGVAAQALILIVPALRSGFRPKLRWGVAGLRSTGQYATWMFAGVTVGILGSVVVTRVTSSVVGDSFVGNNGYDNAYLIFSLPHALVTVSLVTALFTRLARNVADDDLPAVHANLSLGLRTVALFTNLATVGLIVLAGPVLRVLFPGVNGAVRSDLTTVVIVMAIGLTAYGSLSVVQRVYYAYEDAKALFPLQVMTTVIIIVGSLLGQLVAPQRWWAAIAAASMTLSYVIGVFASLYRLQRRIGLVQLGSVVRVHVRASFAAIAAATAGALLSALLGDVTSFVEAVVRLVVVGTVIVAVYLGILVQLRVNELGFLLRPFASRLPLAVTERIGLVRTGGPAAAGSDDRPDPVSDGMAAGPGAGDASDIRDGVGSDDPAMADAPASWGTDLSGSAAWGIADRPARLPLASWGPEPRPSQEARMTSDAPAPLLAGRYRLDHTIPGALPATQEWAALDTTLDRAVRVRLITGGDVTQILDGARRAALVTDQRLIRILDVGTDGDNGYVVTEYVTGRTLNDIVGDGPISHQLARTIVGEAAVAIEAARTRGVHHLALRPQSVLVTADRRVVVDGMAIDAAVSGIVITDAMTANRADARGLARLLYAALTGTWPEVSDTLPAGLPAAPTADHRPVRPSTIAEGVPADLDTLCWQALGHVDDGLASPAELIADIEPWHRVTDLDSDALLPEPTGFGSLATGGAAPGVDALGLGAADATGMGLLEAIPAAVPRVSVRETLRGTSHRWLDVPPAATPDEGNGLSSGIGAAGAGAAGGAAPGVVAAGGTAAGASSDGLLPPTFPPAGSAAGPSGPAGTSAAGTSGAGPTAGPSAAAPFSQRTAPPPASWQPDPVQRGVAFPPTSAPFEPQAPPPFGTHRPPISFDQAIGAKSLRSTRFDPTAIVLLVVGAVVVIGLFIAAKTFFGSWNLPESGPRVQPSITPTPSASTPQRPSPSPSATAAARPVISGAAAVNFDGTEGDHQELTAAAFDGDPTTAWFSQTYSRPDFSGARKGTGLVISLGAPATVHTVTLHGSSVGGTIEIRASDASAPATGAILGTATQSGDTVITLSQPVETSSISIWFTSLPQLPDGTNKIEITEVEIS